MTPSITVPLFAHPANPSPAVEAVEVQVSVTESGALVLAYTLRGDLGNVRIPAPRPAGAADGLWEHTCFEVFVAEAGSTVYREFNFSPSGQWAAYAFSGYRLRDEAILPPQVPEIAVRQFPDRLELDAFLFAAQLPPGRPLRLGLSAVVEAADGSRSYWALAHPDAKPDFHRREAFVLDLPDPHTSH